MIALAVRLTVLAIRARKGLSPPSECALPGAQTKTLDLANFSSGHGTKMSANFFWE
jgi:hypothetical protein